MSEVLLGCAFCILAAFTLASSMVIQRYALATPKEQAGCILKALGPNKTWGIGMLVYVLGNVFYLIGLNWTPLALASALVATLLVFNTILSYYVLGSRVTVYDIAGNSLFLAAVAVVAAFGPSPTAEDAIYSPERLTSNAGEVMGAVFLVFVCALLCACIALVHRFEKTYPHFGSDSDKLEIHERVSLAAEEDSEQDDSDMKIPSAAEVTMMQLVYPIVLGTFEALVQICLKSWTGFLWNGFSLIHPLSLIMLFILVGGTVMTVTWLRKVYGKYSFDQSLLSLRVTA